MLLTGEVGIGKSTAVQVLRRRLAPEMPVAVVEAASWSVGPVVFTPANAEYFGEGMGHRYHEKDLIWILGGDRPIEEEEAIRSKYLDLELINTPSLALDRARREGPYPERSTDLQVLDENGTLDEALENR